MTDLQLTRTGKNRRFYELDGVGTLRLEGFLLRAATARADGATWGFARRGFWRTRIVATDATAAVVGDFGSDGTRRGGRLSWEGRTLALRPASKWRERYALADGDVELAVLDGKSWGRRPVKVTVEDPNAVEPGLLLFAVFVVRGLAADAADAAAAGSSAAATGG